MRSADEFDLRDVQQLDVRRVGVQHGHAVDERRDRRVRGAGADAAKAWIGQLPGGELGKVGVGRKDAGIADRASELQPVDRHDGDADRKALDVSRLLLRRDGHRRQRDRTDRLPCRLGGWGLPMRRRGKERQTEDKQGRC